MNFNSYLIYEYQHFPLPGLTKQSVHSSLFFTPFPMFDVCKMQTICFYIKIQISHLLKSNTAVVQLVEQLLYFKR